MSRIQPRTLLWQLGLALMVMQGIVAVVFGIPLAVFAEAVLGFIGIGIAPPTASLGRLVGDGYRYIELNVWVVIFPASAIALLMLCFTFLGDGLRDALDPRGR